MAHIVLLGFLLPAPAASDSFPYEHKILATNKTSTMGKEHPSVLGTIHSWSSDQHGKGK